MSSSDRSKALYALLHRLRSRQGRGRAGGGALAPSEVEAKVTAAGAPSVCPVERCFQGDLVLREFVRSYLAWEAPLAKAEAALARIAEAMVDVNEFRVCLEDEVAGLLGSTYPRLEDRIARLRASLGDVFRREHCLRLEHLRGKSKREARSYLESLKGVPAFVPARTSLVALEVHAFPVDERLHAKLLAARVIEDGMGPDDTAGWLERTLKAGEAGEAYRLMQRWVDGAGKAPARRGARARTTRVPEKRRSGTR